MAPSTPTHFSEGEEKLIQESKELVPSLHKIKGWRSPFLYDHQGFWCASTQFQDIYTFQNHFQAKDTDVVLAAIPKSGIIWLKALTFAIVNRQKFSFENHPLLTFNPHELVLFFEFGVYGKYPKDKIPHHLINEQGLFATQIPFNGLAKSIKESNSKIIYLSRNPFDTFVSHWLFDNQNKHNASDQIPLEETFERFCKGESAFGPWWNHKLDYWKQSIAKPNKVLFLHYEDLQEDANSQVKKIAKFLGLPFTEEEKSSGVIDSIVKLCSFENLKDLEVNKTGKLANVVENKYFFRKGEVGDWKNYLSPSMAEKLSKVVEEKFSGTGLSFKVQC